MGNSEEAIHDNLSGLSKRKVETQASIPVDAQFRSLNRHVASLATRNPVNPRSNRMGNRTIQLPPGSYLLTEPTSFIDGALWETRTSGLAIVGDGPPGSVVVLYKPTKSGPLINNPDRLLNLQLKNLSFVGYDEKSAFFDSLSTGGAQSYTFEDCYFGGTWRHGVSLTGTNTNSEMKWLRCVFNGNWHSYLFSPDVNNRGSDQFLNYWFTNCQVSGPSALIDMATGGGIRMTDCDVSGYQGQVAQTYLINLRGTAHARGVCSFVWKGGRVEQKTPFAGVVYCEWPTGTVDFDCVDFSSQAGNPKSDTMISAQFVIAANSGPHVTWRNCQLMGRHQYRYGSNSFQYKPGITYNDCTILNFSKISDFLDLPDGPNTGGRIPVEFNNCSLGKTLRSYDVFTVKLSSPTARFTPTETLTFSNGASAALLAQTVEGNAIAVRAGAGILPTTGTVKGSASASTATIAGCQIVAQDIEICDVTFNWQQSANGFTKTRTISLKDYNSRCPFAGSMLLKCLPLGSIITRARLVTQGQAYAGPWHLAMKTASGKLLAATTGMSMSGTGKGGGNGGFSVDNNLWLPLLDDFDRTVVYQDLQNWTQAMRNVYALIDYI